MLISKSQTLSEDFIIEFKDKVDWWYISINSIKNYQKNLKKNLKKN